MDVHYFEMSYDDIPFVAEIERKYFSQPWTEASLNHYMDAGNTIFIIAKDDNGKILGYSAVMCIVDESDLISIAVEEEFRGMGIARELLDISYDMAAERGVEKLHLEVRAGNSPAINLYESEGFERVGLRKNYYEKPVEDALLYTRLL